MDLYCHLDFKISRSSLSFLYISSIRYKKNTKHINSLIEHFYIFIFHYNQIKICCKQYIIFIIFIKIQLVMKITQKIVLTYISLAFNFIAAIIIITLIYKRKQQKTASGQHNNIIEIQANKTSIVNTEDSSMGNNQVIESIIDKNYYEAPIYIQQSDITSKGEIYLNSTLKIKSQISEKVQLNNSPQNTNLNAQIVQKQLKAVQQLKNRKLLLQKDEKITALEQQLHLQTQRNIHLQNDNQKLKKHVQLFQKQLQKCKRTMKQSFEQQKWQKKAQQKQAQITNLKNELQFCQAKIDQYVKNEIQLKNKLQDYQKTYSIIICHPQYQRLKALNNQYKNTISVLQKHLLERSHHQSSRPDGLNLSFGDF